MIEKIKIVYFAYLLSNNWENIVIEQLNSLKSLELYNIASNIYMSVISDENELKKLKNLLKDKYEKIELINVYNENLYEYPGFKTLYEISDNYSIILYFHTKGMTSKHDNIRKNLFKWTIETYVEILNEFNNNDNLEISCSFPNKNSGFAYFNFFWVRGSYVIKYHSNPEISKNRFVWEEWIGCKDKNVITYSTLIKYEQTTKKNIMNTYYEYANKKST